jgi:septal ring factor EnvC (AmiA/AmiB activator)
MKNYKNTETNKKTDLGNPDVVKSNVKALSKEERDYIYYSKVLKEPFETIGELKEAEEAYYAKLKAKEDAAAQKKSDALKVEDAFKALNTARKNYKDDLTALTTEYSENLKKLKELFEKERATIQDELAKAEETYSAALKEFTAKYDQFHLTLKDGDFETTINHGSTTKELPKALDLFDLFFRF